MASLVDRPRLAQRNAISNVVDQNAQVRETLADHPPHSRGSRLYGVNGMSGMEDWRRNTYAEGIGLGEVPWSRVGNRVKHSMPYSELL